MLYLVHPPASVKWVDLPAEDVQLADSRGTLSTLDWKEAGVNFSRQLLDLALRRGTACSLGLLVDPLDVRGIGQLAEVRGLIAALADSEERIAETGLNEYMEAKNPQWAKANREFEEDFDRLRNDRLAEAQEQRQALLSGEANPDLVAHWQDCGGEIA